MAHSEFQEDLNIATKSDHSGSGRADDFPAHLMRCTLDFELTDSAADETDASCIVVTISSNGILSEAAYRTESISDDAIRRLYERGSITGEIGDAVAIPVFDHSSIRTILVVGTGNPAVMCREDFARILKTGFDGVTSARVDSAALFLSDIPVNQGSRYWRIREQVVVGERHGYQYSRAESNSMPGTLKKLLIQGNKEDEVAVSHGRAFATSQNMAKTLSDMPPNICTPSYLAIFASNIAERTPTITTEIIDEDEMSRLGMNVILSVGRGSSEPSKFIIMRFNGAAPDDAPFVLIGKGVTFDTGGTSIKTLANMKRMKYDMCGAASTISVVTAAAQLDLPINIVGICACVENMPGAGATRPSDVVRSMSGKTVEILNPDAEGRLILCDALTYARKFSPAAVIDIATLTGASLVALGRHYSALFSNQQALADALLQAGDETMDKAWQLPLPDEELPQLNSDFADIANIGDGTAGCIVAALFLSTFANDYPWAHLDVSNTAKKHGESVGATGRPTSLLLQFLLRQCVDKTSKTA